MTIEWAIAQINHLPFDRLSLPAEQDFWQAGASGDILKSCNFSAHAEFVEA